MDLTPERVCQLQEFWDRWIADYSAGVSPPGELLSRAMLAGMAFSQQVRPQELQWWIESHRKWKHHAA